MVDLGRRQLQRMGGPEPDGVQVETTPLCTDANKVFSPVEMEERLKAHRERVLRDEVLSPEEVRMRASCGKGGRLAGRRHKC